MYTIFYIVPGIYTTFVMLMNTWSVMLTVLVLNLHHRNECRPIPGWLRTAAFEGLARVLCMYSKDQEYITNLQQRRKASSFSNSDFICRRPNASTLSPNILTVDNDNSKKLLSKPKKSRLPYMASRRLAEQLANQSMLGGLAKSPNEPPPDSPLTFSHPAHNQAGTQLAHRQADPQHAAVNHDGGHFKLLDNCTDRRRSSSWNEEAATYPQDSVIHNMELQEWKRLARIIDRLFFWLTLTALISVSVVLSCLRFWI